jgi:peptidoglycan/LPS O-acetylase OafA/YrhL
VSVAVLDRPPRGVAVGDFAWGWTLSLEEQFYLAWPFGLALALRAGRVRLLAVVTGALVATSCLLRVVLPIGDAQESARVYAGIDTRMSGLLIGCLLALLLHHRPAS